MMRLAPTALLFYCLAPLPAEQADPYAAIRTAQEGAAQKQREAVRKQVLVVSGRPSDEFFAVPFWKAAVDEMQAPPTTAACDPLTPDALRKTVEAAALREGLPADLLQSVIEKESAFKPFAISHKGARGLMQLMPATQALLGVTDAFDPEQNIFGGGRYLKQMLARYDGNLPLALSAYNAGPGRVDRAGGVPEIRETKNYVSDLVKKLEPRVKDGKESGTTSARGASSQ